ncbi:MAG: glycoside hydrolase family 2 protein [Planctomycetota bacterium]
MNHRRPTPWWIFVWLLFAILTLPTSADGPRAPLMTRWAADVTPDRVHPEYPRPQLVRADWQSLNGEWQYAIRPRDEGRPATWDGVILVPFAVESALSGVMRSVAPTELVWYRRSFSVPSDWQGRQVWLHFGGVDWEARVWVDGRELGVHRGGFDPFSFELTSALASGDQHELVVAVWDPTDTGTQPRGKQVLKPHGIWYTAVTGIWQSVWLEPLPERAVRSLKIVPDLNAVRVHVELEAADDVTIEVRAFDAGRAVADATGRDVTLSMPDPRHWSPASPTLYDLEVRVLRGEIVVDTVRSYFGLRTIALGKDAAGVPRLVLNGEPLFQLGVLDQGWWPDGLYTAPSEVALRHDLDLVKNLGFNMVRKHVKVEPARFYYWCDRIGLLVWQDMPSGDGAIGPSDPDLTRTPESARQFERELDRMLDTLGHFPCVVAWVPFNEGWGQFETERILASVKSRDPTRIVDGPSGWTDRGSGETRDVHVYPGPGMSTIEPRRAAVLGEFGGFGLPVAGHTWQADGSWSYRSFTDSTALTTAYVACFQQLRPLIANGLTAAVYTQLSDVELEVNGLVTYDRAHMKIEPARVQRAHQRVLGPRTQMRVLLPTAQSTGLPAPEWRFTLDAPAAGWERAEFVDSAWSTGPGGFGTAGTPGASIGTQWDTAEIWLRRRFTIAADDLRAALRAAALDDLFLAIHHDEDAEVFLNGERIAELNGYTTGYTFVPLSARAALALRNVDGVLAIHCRQSTGGQFIDAGIVWLEPEQRKK